VWNDFSLRSRPFEEGNEKKRKMKSDFGTKNESKKLSFFEICVDFIESIGLWMNHKVQIEWR